MSKKKLSMSEVKKIPPASLLRLINKAKKELKQDGVMQEVFKEYSVDIDEIDLIPTFFKKLDVSAKTDHAIVWLNYSLLLDGAFDRKDYSYLIHEYTHWLQQTTGTKPTQSADDGSYLDNPFEQEGFSNQVEYIAKQFGEDEAENYVDDLLEHHEVDKKELKEKKEIFMSKANLDIQKLIRGAIINDDMWKILVDYLLENGLIEDNTVKDVYMYIKNNYELEKIHEILVKDAKIGDLIVVIDDLSGFFSSSNESIFHKLVKITEEPNDSWVTWTYDNGMEQSFRINQTVGVIRS